VFKIIYCVDPSGGSIVAGNTPARKTDKTSRKDALLIATAAGQAKAKEKANQKAIDQYARRKRVATDRKSKVQDAKAKFTPRRLQDRPDRKFGQRPKKSDSLGAPDLNVKPEAPEPTPADIDEDGVELTGVVTADDRDQAARAAAETLDDDVPGVVESPQELVIDLTQEEDPGGIIASAVGGDDQKPVVNEPMLIPAGGDDQPMQADEPVNDLKSFLYHVPEPVKSEVVDLTQTQADDPGGVMLEPLAPMDSTNPEQPHNILRQQPGGEDQPMEEEDLNTAQGGDEQPMEIGEEGDPGNIIRNIVHGGEVCTLPYCSS
jgi:hypothetical protein